MHAPFARSHAPLAAQMEQLAFENYKSFIETADCVRQVSAKIVSINSELDRVVGSLPALVTVCEDFCAKAGNGLFGVLVGCVLDLGVFKNK